MRMDIIFLGTSGSIPTKDRNLPSFAIFYNGDLLLFDCGEGTQRQMQIQNVKISKLKAIFITHTHGDHVIGIAGIVRTLALMRRKDPLFIFVPKGFEDIIANLITFDKALIEYEIKIIGINSGIVYKTDEYIIKAFKLKHTISTFGYVFKEKDRYKFYKDKCRLLGIKGTMFSKLLKYKRIVIRNKVIKLKDVAYKKMGIKIVYASDTRPVINTINAARNADLLIHEATYVKRDAILAKERMHSTAEEAAKIAKRANVRYLILTHIGSRYKDFRKILKEARSIFNNTYIAYDGYRFVLGASSSGRTAD